MELFTELFGDLLTFVYHCLHRIVIYGYLSGLSRPEQVVHFFRQIVGVPAVDKEILSQRTADYQPPAGVDRAASGEKSALCVAAKPCVHSTMSARLAKPRAARRAASSPFCAALPAWNGLHIVPNCALSPAAWVAAMPRAAAAPRLPTVPVA
jgi:hypothetical protein